MTAGLREGLSDPLLRVEGLEKHFRIRAGRRKSELLRAVDDLSFDVARGETLGLVGESGCGKSTAARCILRLIEPTRGRVTFGAEDVTSYSPEQLRHARRQMQIVFQDPYGSLNPRMTVRSLVEEPLQIHGVADKAARGQRVDDILARVGIARALAGRKPTRARRCRRSRRR